MTVPAPLHPEQPTEWTRQDTTVARLTPVGQSATTPPPPAEAPATPHLLLHRGPGAGRTFAVPAGATTVGRDRNCGIVLDDPAVSRRHAELIRTGAEIVLRDLGSLNGTYLNRRPCDHAALANGDEVWIGTFRFTVRL